MTGGAAAGGVPVDADGGAIVALGFAIGPLITRGGAGGAGGAGLCSTTGDAG